MTEAITIKWLSKAIGQATKSVEFCTAGQMPAVDAGLQIEGQGYLKFPLKPAAKKKLMAACHDAPFGKGTQTIVDKNVRNTYELDPASFRLSPAWNAAIGDLLPPIAEQLGLPANQLEARLYKLLAYDKGGFFLPHRDGEKHDGMVASLIVALPNPFEGGHLVVRHGNTKETFKFREAAKGDAPSYVAFYADCEHEVEPVNYGFRLCLAYNLVLKATAVQSSTTTKSTARPGPLAASLESWFKRNPAEPLVFALEHHYTERGLALDLLKGADRQLANLIVAAAEQNECVVHLSQVSRHLLQSAEDGSYGYPNSRHYRPPSGKITIGEAYEDELYGKEWTDVHGKPQPWGEIAFDPASIVSSTPIDDWKPTSEEYEGFTGNAGNTLDRWYHRSAIVLWKRERHFDAVASAGISGAMPLFRTMMQKLPKTPLKRMDDAYDDCVRFARAIIGQWPHSRHGFDSDEKRSKSPYEDFPDILLTLHDRDAIGSFLAKLAENDSVMPIASFVLAACREFGWAAFQAELKLLLSTRPSKHGMAEISTREAEWLAAYCCEPADDATKAALGQELCKLAVNRIRQPRPTQPQYSHSRERSIPTKALTPLFKAVIAAGSKEELSRLVGFVREPANAFNFDDFQVPCLKSLIPWTRKTLGEVPPPLATWLQAARAQLESATAQAPAPPPDWARPSDVKCACRYCVQLRSFLADPTQAAGRIAAAESARTHLISTIQHRQCDVKHALERKGSPFSLVLTKSLGSFDRTVKRYQADRKLLSDLPGDV